MRPRLHSVLPLRLVACFWVGAALASFAGPEALTNWQTARITFQRAGAAIEEADLNPARQQLVAAGTSLPAPYGAMATAFVTRLDAAAKKPVEKQGRSRALVELCAAMGAYGQALKIQAAYSDKEDLQDDPTYAWRLFETGQADAAIAEYRRRIKEEMVETFVEHYKAQLRLLSQRATNISNAEYSLKLVKEHYLRGFEEKADNLGALQELYRVLPFTKDPANSVAVISEIILRLGALNDEAGRLAWEDQILTRFASDPAGCANVYLERGLRAFWARDFTNAMMQCRKVCREYPDAPAYGDAQLTVAMIHEREGRFDEAIAEYEKIFPSKVRDHDLDVNKSDDCKNYRHRAALRISDCYEAKGDLTNALSYAEAARDRYLYVSYCKTCLRDQQANVAQRIAELKDKAAHGTTPSTPSKN